MACNAYEALRRVAFAYGEQMDKLVQALNEAFMIISDNEDDREELSLTRIAEETEWESKLSFGDDEIWSEIAFIASENA